MSAPQSRLDFSVGVGRRRARSISESVSDREAPRDSEQPNEQEAEDKRIRPTPTFEQVKPQIENYIAHRAQAELVENLRKSATVERLDKPAAADPSLNPAAPAKK